MTGWMGFVAKPGIGIDEKKLIEMVGRSDFNAANIKRKRQLMMIEFQRFMVFRKQNKKKLFLSYINTIFVLLYILHLFVQNATLMWMTSPAERDARLLRKAIKTRGTRVGIMVIIEIACTREFCDVSAAKEVYHHLYKNSLEFDLSRFIIGPEQTVGSNSY